MIHTSQNQEVDKMHRTQLYIENDIFAKAQQVSKSLNISISEFIRRAIKNELHGESKSDMQNFFDKLEPLESFKEVDSTRYVDGLRNKSRILND